MQSKLRAQSIAMDLVDGTHLLFAQIEIDCPACGQYTMRIAGHHLRALRDFCIATIDAYPDRTGEDPVEVTTDQISFTGGGGQDPSMN